VSRALPGLAALIIVLAPFREGGREALGLLLLHTLALLFVLLSFLRAASAPRGAGAWGALPPGPARAVAGLGAATLLLAAISALRAGYPLAACLGLLDLAAGAGVFVAALAARPSAGDLGLMGSAAVLSTSLQAALALLRFAGGGGTKAAGAGFLNPNHLAAFLNLGLLLSVAAADRAWDDGDRRRARLWAGAAALHLAAVALLASRGALLGLGAALSIFVALRFRTWSRARRAAALAALALALLAAGGLVARRFGRWQDPLRYQRLAIWKAAGGMLAERPLLGHGPGMFRHLSAAYNVPLDRGPIRFERRFASAHSAPLTLAVEDGAPAAACLLAAAALAAFLLLRARGSGPPGLARGLGLALAALLAHAAVEDLQERPALVLVPALLAGAILGAAGTDPRRAAATDPGGPGPERRVGGVRSAALASAITVASVAFAGAVLLPYLADHEARAARRQDARGLRRMERAARLNPLHPEYRHDLAMATLNSGPPTAERYAEAALHLVAARRLKPIDPRFPLLLARLEAGIGEALFSDASAGGRAAALYAEAAALAPLDPRPLLEMAGHLARLQNHQEALEAAGAALKLEPNFVRARILEASILAGLGRAEEARAAFGRLLATEQALRGFIPESGYAADLVRGAPEERQSLERLLGLGPPDRGVPSGR
jgi:O-antigen ligase